MSIHWINDLELATRIQKAVNAHYTKDHAPLASANASEERMREIALEAAKECITVNNAMGALGRRKEAREIARSEIDMVLKEAEAARAWGVAPSLEQRANEIAEEKCSAICDDLRQWWRVHEGDVARQEIQKFRDEWWREATEISNRRVMENQEVTEREVRNATLDEVARMVDLNRLAYFVGDPAKPACDCYTLGLPEKIRALKSGRAEAVCNCGAKPEEMHMQYCARSRPHVDPWEAPHVGVDGTGIGCTVEDLLREIEMLHASNKVARRERDEARKTGNEWKDAYENHYRAARMDIDEIGKERDTLRADLEKANKALDGLALMFESVPYGSGWGWSDERGKSVYAVPILQATGRLGSASGGGG